MSTADNLPTAQPSLLASLRDRHRITKSGIYINMLSITERKQFYNEAVDLVLKCPTGNLSGPEAARTVAMVYGINIAECDKARIRVPMNNRLRSARTIAGFIADVTSEPIDDGVATANTGHEARGAKRRRAGVASVVAKNTVSEDIINTLPSSKLQRPFKGAISHLDYQEIVKVEASAVATRFKAA